MSDFFRGYVTGILVYMVVLLAVPMCSSAKADTVSSRPYIESIIVHTATANGVDPQLALAVVEVESGFNPKARGRAGEVGLFQLHPSYFPNAPEGITKNIELGIKHLMFWETKCYTKTKHTWVTCFNSGNRKLKSPQLAPYYRKVISAYKRRQNPSAN